MHIALDSMFVSSISASEPAWKPVEVNSIPVLLDYEDNVELARDHAIPSYSKIDKEDLICYNIHMNRHGLGSPENRARPWGPSNGKEATLDALTLGLTRHRREERIRAHYASMDEYRLSHHGRQQETTPNLLPNVV